MEDGETFAPQGNRIPDAAPHEGFPCQGSEEWVAIAAFGEAEWPALCEATDRPDLGADPRFATLPDRKRHEDEPYSDIAAWTRACAKGEAAEILQRHGVRAAPVVNGRDIFEGPQLTALGFYAEIEYADAGRHRYPGLAFHLGATPGGVRRPPPRFAEHNHAVLVGLTEGEYAALERDGVIASEPTGG